MQEQNDQPNAEQTMNRRPSQRQPLKVCLCLIGAALVLNVALASAALNYLVPKVVRGKQGIAARMDWYLHKGQLQADARTAVATLQFIVGTERDASTVTNLADLPVAENAAPSAPKS